MVARRPRRRNRRRFRTGSGDVPIEQYIREAKVDSLYEGTTAIQALDFFFRKIIRDRGAALDHVTSQLA